MKVRYIGDPNERAFDVPASRRSIEWFGVTFPSPHFDRPAQVVDISHLSQEAQRKISANSHFEVVEGEAQSAPEAPEGTVIDEGDAPLAPVSRKRKA